MLKILLLLGLGILVWFFIQIKRKNIGSNQESMNEFEDIRKRIKRRLEDDSDQT